MMITLICSAIALGLDGFLVCLCLGSIVPAHLHARLAISFGLCDAAASAAGALLGVALPWAVALEAIIGLVVIGLMVYPAWNVLSSQAKSVFRSGTGWILLPIILSLDNFAAGARVQGMSVVMFSFLNIAISGIMSFVGIKLGAMTSGRIRLVLAYRN